MTRPASSPSSILLEHVGVSIYVHKFNVELAWSVRKQLLVHRLLISLLVVISDSCEATNMPNLAWPRYPSNHTLDSGVQYSQSLFNQTLHVTYWGQKNPCGILHFLWHGNLNNTDSPELYPISTPREVNWLQNPTQVSTKTKL